MIFFGGGSGGWGGWGRLFMVVLEGDEVFWCQGMVQAALGANFCMEIFCFYVWCG